jgi:hypothetical protein
MSNVYGLPLRFGARAWIDSQRSSRVPRRDMDRTVAATQHDISSPYAQHATFTSQSSRWRPPSPASRQERQRVGATDAEDPQDSSCGCRFKMGQGRQSILAASEGLGIDADLTGLPFDQRQRLESRPVESQHRHNLTGSRGQSHLPRRLSPEALGCPIPAVTIEGLG